MRPRVSSFPVAMTLPRRRRLSLSLSLSLSLCGSFVDLLTKKKGRKRGNYQPRNRAVAIGGEIDYNYRFIDLVCVCVCRCKAAQRRRKKNKKQTPGAPTAMVAIEIVICFHFSSFHTVGKQKKTNKKKQSHNNKTESMRKKRKTMKPPTRSSSSFCSFLFLLVSGLRPINLNSKSEEMAFNDFLMNHTESRKPGKNKNPVQPGKNPLPTS